MGGRDGVFEDLFLNPDQFPDILKEKEVSFSSCLVMPHASIIYSPSQAKDYINLNPPGPLAQGVKAKLKWITITLPLL